LAKLILNPTSSSRREIPLARTLLSIGRDPSNDLVLPDALVSRRHAVVECRGTQYVIRDCNSSNGSLVNGDRVGEHPLKDGDLLAIGTARLLFRDVEVEDAAAKVVPHPSSPRLQCPACQADYRRGDQFCRKCGAPVPLPPPAHVDCTSCGKSVPLPANFCNSCGAPLPREDGLEATRPRTRPGGEAPAPVPAGPGPLEAPRPLEAAVVSPPPPARDMTPPPPVAEIASVPAAAAASAPKIVPAAARPSPPRPHVPEPTPAPVPRPARPSSPPVRRSTLERAPAVRAEAPRAGFWVRLAAGLLDAGLVGLIQTVICAPGVYYFAHVYGLTGTGDAPREPSFLPIFLSVALAFLAAVLGALYYVYGWGVRGTTPGKAAFGLQVQGEQGEVPIGVGRAVLRLLGYLLSSAILGIGFVMIAFGGDGMHDKLAATRVVRRRRD
jgi:uncharacterized RDD family membrane protein YckC